MPSQSAINRARGGSPVAAPALALSLLWLIFSHEACAATSTPDVNDLIKQGQFKEAERITLQHLSQNPSSERYHIERARLLRSMGRTQEAIAEYDRAASLNPKQVEAPLVLAQIYLDNLDVERSLVYARKAVAADPNSVEARLQLSKALIEEGKIEEAERQAMVMLMRRPTDPRLLYYFYQLEDRKGNYQKARFYLLEAIKQDPSKTAWKLEVADLLEKNGDAGTARDWLRRTLEDEVYNTEARLKLARNLEFFQHDYDAALSQYERVLKQEPASTAAITGIERCRAKKNDIALRLKQQIQSWISPVRN